MEGGLSQLILSLENSRCACKDCRVSPTLSTGAKSLAEHRGVSCDLDLVWTCCPMVLPNGALFSTISAAENPANANSLRYLLCQNAIT